MKRVLVTGSAGFIGFHLSRRLLRDGFRVHGIDGMTPYYDPALKQARHDELKTFPGFSSDEIMLENHGKLSVAVADFEPQIMVHLAAQAGVRYSLENPRAYHDSNLTGLFNFLECARTAIPEHLLIASTSSVYGAGKPLPFREAQRVDRPLTLYAATKVAGEAMAHSYAHLHKIPTTSFRFFTVYGPWGRPDMALFKFTQAILEGKPIEVFNKGEMWRDFTYVDDLVHAVRLLMDCAPGDEAVEEDTLSPVAPYRVVNIGNSNKIALSDFVDAVENALGMTAQKKMLPMQKGDVPATWADCSLLERLSGYKPATDYREGVKRFVEWYRAYYSA